MPNATIRVTARQLPAGAIADLDLVSTDSDGYLIHQPTDAADDPRGMRIAADVLGTPNQQFEVTIKPIGAPDGSSCGQQFTVNIMERQFTRALGTGADLKLAAKKIWGPLGVEGNEGQTEKWKSGFAKERRVIDWPSEYTCCPESTR